MPFIGTQPEVGGYSVLDALTASATASYTLQLNSANFVPASANQLLVSLNGVIQKPGSSFTVSGSTLTFSSALTSSDSIDFIIAMGEPLLIGTPSDNTITTNKLVNDSVTGAKIENNPTIAGNLTVSGNTAASGTLTSTGLITASAGIAIGGTDAAHTLDDYEEGTWTPTSQSNAGTLTSSSGRYTKIGQVVYVSAYVSYTGASTGSDSRVYAGLPFTVNNWIVATSVDFQGLIWANNYSGQIYFEGGTSQFVSPPAQVIRGSYNTADDNSRIQGFYFTAE